MVDFGGRSFSMFMQGSADLLPHHRHHGEGLKRCCQGLLARLAAKPENSYNDARRHCLVGMMPCSFATHMETARQESRSGWQEGQMRVITIRNSGPVPASLLCAEASLLLAGFPSVVPSCPSPCSSPCPFPMMDPTPTHRPSPPRTVTLVALVVALTSLTALHAPCSPGGHASYA